MAVQHPDSVLTYVGNGSTSTAYPVSFRFLLNSDIKVSVKSAAEIDPVLLQEGGDYTLHVLRDSNNVITGGEVTTAIAYDSSYTVFIYRSVPLTQLTELPEFGPFPANSLEMALDKAVMALQQQDRAIRRCFRVSDFSAELSPPYPQPNTVLGISADNDLRMFSGADLLSLIQLPGSLVGAPTAYWLNDFDRPLKVPDFVGQLGLQMDDNALYRSTGVNAGDWFALVLDEDDMASDDPKMPPSQQSVKAYVDAAEASLEAYANNAADIAETAANAYTDAGLATKQPLSLTLCRFTPRDNQPPAANWARASTRNSVSTLRFSDSVEESAVFLGAMPEGLDLSNGVTVQILWTAATATTGGVRWGASFMRLTTDIDADSFGSVAGVTSSVPATSGVPYWSNITGLDLDGMIAGDGFRLKIYRAVADPGDTATDDVEILAVEVRRVV